MAEVKWIKIVTDIFDDEKILLIESIPEADSVIVTWFKLLCLAGKNNNSGVFMLNDKIAYTDEMLSTIFRRPLNTVRLALKTFQQFGMIEIIDDVITIPNWSKHQTLDQLQERKEYMRNYMKGYREKQKLLVSGKFNSKVNSKSNCNANVNSLEEEGEEDIDIDIEEDIERDIEEEKDIEKVVPPYKEIKDLYNSICKSLTQVRSLSNARKKHIQARWEQLDRNLEVFKEVFTKLEESDFCKGNNNRGWKADFDWVIANDNNIIKVLEGKYDNKKINYKDKQDSFNNYDQRSYDYEDLEKKLLGWDDEEDE